MPEPISVSLATKAAGVLLTIGIAWGTLQYQVNNNAANHKAVSALPVKVAIIDERQKNFKDDIVEIKQILKQIDAKVDHLNDQSPK